MKKWMPSLRPKRFLLCYSVCLFLLFGLGLLWPSSSASAVSVGTSGFDLYYRSSPSSSYTWGHNILYGESSGVSFVGTGSSAMRYQFNTTSVTSGGNHASIHFETNIVSSLQSSNTSLNSNFFVNLPQQFIITCTGQGGFSGASITSKNLSYTVTPNWVSSSNHSSSTLTFYGDVALENISPNTSGSFVCSIGSNDYAFFSSGTATQVRLWFEQNPVSISWSSNKTDSLLETQNSLINEQIHQQQSTNLLLQSQIDAQEQANQQQQDQYDAEKQEESDREDDQSDATDELASMFNFNILNPFIGLFGLFNSSSSCVNIPNISSMLNTSNSRVCPFFNSSTRAIVTPVVGISSMMVLFGFAVRWLKSDGEGDAS